MAAELWTQFTRFWSLEDPAVRSALLGVVLLSIASGTLGSFIVLRRLSLLGDSLGHAVLPGVCLGFLVTKTKDPLWIFVGAVGAALLGSWLVTFIRRHTKLKTDVALGLVLSGFFGVGTVLMTRLQQLPYGNQSGLNHFLFGQAAALQSRDVAWIAGCATVIVVGVAVAFKELAVSSFDEQFAVSIGLPTRAIHYLLMTLLAMSIVVSLQAVGVVLLSALLITPAATAYLLTDRLPSMVPLAAGIAVFGGVAGLNLSFLGRSLPTGPFIVIVLGILFTLAFLFSPRHGVVTRAQRRTRQRHRFDCENVLKQLRLALRERSQDAIGLAEFRASLPPHLNATSNAIRALNRSGLLECDATETIRLTVAGVARADELIRNFSLWEKFLSDEANLPSDHTAPGAEDFEHLMSTEIASDLEKRYRHD